MYIVSEFILNIKILTNIRRIILIHIIKYSTVQDLCEHCTIPKSSLTMVKGSNNKVIEIGIPSHYPINETFQSLGLRWDINTFVAYNFGE